MTRCVAIAVPFMLTAGCTLLSTPNVTDGETPDGGVTHTPEASTAADVGTQDGNDAGAAVDTGGGILPFIEAGPADAHGTGEASVVPSGDGTVPFQGTLANVCVKPSSTGKCTGDLSGVGTGYFQISLDMTTKPMLAGVVAVVNQRATCFRGMFWDVRMSNGSLEVETDDGVHYTTLTSTDANVNDGNLHHLWIYRSSGTLHVSIDSAHEHTAASTTSFGALHKLETGTDPCVSAPTNPGSAGPTVPSGLTTSGATSTTISLSWAPSTDPAGVAGYNIYRNGVQVGASTLPTFTDSGLVGATSYLYAVSAYDSEGNTSQPSAPFSASTIGCPIQVVKNTFNTTYDGYITYQNVGVGPESNPALLFDLPSGAVMDPRQCTLANFSAPGMTAVACSQSGATASLAFTGSLQPSGSVGIYYTTQSPSEPAATNIRVTAASCP
jgi:hypothetical protein